MYGGFDVYKVYLGVKLHFTTDTYDYVKYGGKTNATLDTFTKRKDRYFFHNALSFFKKDTLIQVPFNEVLTGKEDRYWVNKIIQNNQKVLYDPSLSVYHHYTLNGATWKGIG